MTPNHCDSFAAHTPEVMQNVNFRPRRKVFCTTSLFHSTRPILALHNYISNNTPSSLNLGIPTLCFVSLRLIFTAHTRSLCSATYKKPKLLPEHWFTSHNNK